MKYQGQKHLLSDLAQKFPKLQKFLSTVDDALVFASTSNNATATSYLSSVSAAERVGGRHTGADGGFLTWIDISPVLNSGSYSPSINVTTWLDHDDGNGWIWNGWSNLKSSTQTIPVEVWLPDPGKTSWKVAAVLGTIGATNTLPEGTVQSILTVNSIAACPNNDITNAVISSVTTVTQADGTQVWGFKMTFTVPTQAADPAFWVAQYYVQAGSGVGGSFTPRTDFYGKTPTDQDYPTFDYPAGGPGRRFGSSSSLGQPITVYVTGWGFLDTSTYRITIYAVSALGTPQTGGTATRQLAFSGVAYYDIQPTTGGLNATKMDPGTIDSSVGVSGGKFGVQVVDGSLIKGIITAGGAGSTVTYFEVTDASGSTVAWAGDVGSKYGLWASNFWAGGTGPSSATVYIDGLGNGYFTGTVAASTVSGCNIISPTIVVAGGSFTVNIDTTIGVKVSSPSNGIVNLGSGYVDIRDYAGAGYVGEYSYDHFSIYGPSPTGVYCSFADSGGTTGTFVVGYGAGHDAIRVNATSGQVDIAGPITEGGTSLAAKYAPISGSANYAPATSGSAILKGNGSGGFSSASAGTDYQGVISGAPGTWPSFGTAALHAATDFAPTAGVSGSFSVGNGLIVNASGAQVYGGLNVQSGGISIGSASGISATLTLASITTITITNGIITSYT